jgi:hypothetical protein
MAMANAVDPKPPDEDGNRGKEHGRDTTPAPTTTTSYADRLKTNVRYDHRLKRNVLEITIEKSDKEARIDLEPEMVKRIMNSIGLDIGNQVEGYQIIYGRVCLISVWVVKGVSLDKFCQRENIIVTKGVVTGTIRPAGRRDVIVTFAGVDFNTPDSLIQGYIQKFGGKLMSQNVSYGRYSEGPFIGKINNERKYQVDFSDSRMKMGTYHFLDGARVRVFYKGNEKTCGRCHQGQSGCPGGGLSKECEKEGGVRRLLTDHMRKLWAEINFTPTSFELPDEAEVDGAGEEDTKDGDRPVTDTRAPAVNRPAISTEAKEKLVALKINNLPLEITEEEVVKLLKERVKPDIESVNFEMTRTERNTQVVIFSGLGPDDILAAVTKMDFKENKEKILGRPIYCKPMKNLTPTKEKDTEKVEEENVDDKEPTADKKDETVDKHTKATKKDENVNKPKPKLLNMTAGKKPETQTPSRKNNFPIFLSSPAPKSLFATALLNGEMSPEDIATPAGGEKRDASQLSPNSPQAPPKKEIKSGIPVGFGAMPGQK